MLAKTFPMRPYFLITLALFTSAWIAVSAPRSQPLPSETVTGITNLSPVGTAGAIQPAAMPIIKKMGYISLINLQEAGEPGANVGAEEAAAKDAGLRYFHIPFNSRSPDPAAADKFIEVIASEGTQPALIHCAHGVPCGHDVVDQAPRCRSLG